MDRDDDGSRSWWSWFDDSAEHGSDLFLGLETRIAGCVRGHWVCDFDFNHVATDPLSDPDLNAT